MERSVKASWRQKKHLMGEGINGWEKFPPDPNRFRKGIIVNGTKNPLCFASGSKRVVQVAVYFVMIAAWNSSVIP